MKIERTIRGFAGTVILASLLLAHYNSPYWLWLTAFVGANLLQSSLTRWCLLESILRRAMPSDAVPGTKKEAATLSRSKTSHDREEGP